MATNISKQFKIARVTLGESQEMVSIKSGIPQKTISKIETGKEVLLSTAKKLAEYYGFRLELVDLCGK
jgi:DNA-binding XRE family transcriptional regulator